MSGGSKTGMGYDEQQCGLDSPFRVPHFAYRSAADGWNKRRWETMQKPIKLTQTNAVRVYY